MKSCNQCGEAKPLTEFYALPLNSDGRAGHCKACHRARMTLRRRTNPAVQAYDRMRSKRPEKKAQIKAVSDRWKKRYPERARAHYTLTNAVRDGRIQKLPCEVCGSTDHVHGHHHDYSKPLNVTWLCALHHHRGHADGVI
jgi:hypothetical protein